jgi:hypothetical protein
MGARQGAGILIIATVAAAAVPRGPDFPQAITAEIAPTDCLASINSQSLDEILRSDLIAALGASAAKYRAEVNGFTATLHKRERIGKTLHPAEVIKVAVREDPFAVSMVWLAGARNQAEGTLYATGENGGNMTVWRPNAFLAKTLAVGPRDALARSAARYCLAESSVYHGHYRTYSRWKQARDEGRLNVEVKAKRPIPELGDRVCYEVVRTCDPPEADSFLIGEAPRQSPTELFRTVTLYLDADTGLQVGAILTRADGELVGSYLFRDLTFNPAFPPGQFTVSGLRK